VSEKQRVQVDKEHYFSSTYDNKERFLSYWHQINELQALPPRSLLEIGIGSGLVSQYLKQRSVEILTLDTDIQLNPDIAGDVTALPFINDSYETVACFELLEHLPYQDFFTALKEINRVTQRYALLSLPDCSRSLRMFLHLPVLGSLKFIIPFLPKLKASRHDFDGQHYWEIGKASYPLTKIQRDIKSCGFTINRSYRVFEAPWYRFFILEKS